MADDLILAAKDLYKKFADTIGVWGLVAHCSHKEPTFFLNSYSTVLIHFAREIERCQAITPDSTNITMSPLQRDMSIKKMYCLWQNNTCKIQGSAA
jgi:hypothetical protein